MSYASFRILLIDDEDAQRTTLQGFLSKQGLTVSAHASGSAAIEEFRQHASDLILTDLRMPDLDGTQVVREILSLDPTAPVVVMTAFGSIDSAVRIMKQGAFDYIQKPIDLDELLLIIARARERSALLRENRDLKTQLREKFRFDSILGTSSAIEEVVSLAARVAPSTATVLLRGESGTGKELVAHAIHLASDRAEKPFVVVNCAALPDTLFESELFGHERGAFTGAEQRRIGKFELADSGTLFIDEVGDIPLPIQVKLLRAIQFGQVERLGGSAPLHLDVRIIAATHRPLESMIENGLFREDLFYRLNVVPIHLPPLRRRKEDIPVLAESFVQRYAKDNGRSLQGISREAMDLLLRYDFPGNVRELENLMQRAVVLGRDPLVTTADLPTTLHPTRSSEHAFALMAKDDLRDLTTKVELLETAYIEEALRRTGGNQVKAATLLGISERTLRYKLGKRKDECSEG